MEYYHSTEMNARLNEIITRLNWNHINQERIACFYSKGSSTKRVLARVHGLSKIQQLGMKTEPFYSIELISETFNKLSEEDKTKTLIHELLHIPKNFGGGFRQHDFVNRDNVNLLYKQFRNSNITD